MIIFLWCVDFIITLQRYQLFSIRAREGGIFSLFLCWKKNLLTALVLSQKVAFLIGIYQLGRMLDCLIVLVLECCRLMNCELRIENLLPPPLTSNL